MATQAPNPDTVTFLLRPATEEDALSLSVLAMQVFLDTYATEGVNAAIAREALSAYTERTFLHAINDDISRVCVAEKAGSLLGFAQVTLGARHELAPVGVQAELLRLYVQERFTGHGVGTRLLANAEQIASQAGASILWLSPWVHNHRALSFYARRGYHDYGLTYFMFQGMPVENRVYAKSTNTNAA